MKPGEKPAALTCLETGDWKGAYPKCLPRDPLDTALICEVNMKLGGLTAEQVIEDRTFKNKTIDSIKAVLGVPISDVNRKLTIEVSFPGLITQRGKQTKGRPLDLKVKTNIFFMNKTEAVLDKIALTEAFSDKSTSNDTQQTSLYLGEGGNSHKKEKFAAVFASAANASVKVEKFGVAAVNVAKPDWRVNPFVKKVHMKSKMPLPHVQPNQTVRDPGVTEINIQGTYDRATGQWHKAPPPSDLMESDQELDDAETTQDLATLREIYRERIEEEDKTDDVELEEELVELALV